jgi:hypothetical protein
MTTLYKILVCGSRTYNNHDTINTVLTGLYATHGRFTLIHGAAKGADTLADEWANNTLCATVRVPANWELHGKSAGPIRNKQMLDYGPHLVVAFVDKPLHESRGTNHMVTIARAAGVRTLVLEDFDGNLNKEQYSAATLVANDNFTGFIATDTRTSNINETQCQP